MGGTTSSKRPGPFSRTPDGEGAACLSPRRQAVKGVPKKPLEEVDGPLPQALEDINVPTYLMDRTGIIRWINPACERLVGNVVGKQATSVVAPEEKRRVLEALARKLAGTEHVTNGSVVVFSASGD